MIAGNKLISINGKTVISQITYVYEGIKAIKESKVIQKYVGKREANANNRIFELSFF